MLRRDRRCSVTRRVVPSRLTATPVGVAADLDALGDGAGLGVDHRDGAVGGADVEFGAVRTDRQTRSMRLVSSTIFVAFFQDVPNTSTAVVPVAVPLVT